MRRLGYTPALDGVRGIAIAIVLVEHFGLLPTTGGYAVLPITGGIDLFFVLSGFLITTLLLEEHAETGRISLRGFYARRARRLLPGLFVMLAVFAAIAVAKGIDPLPDLARYGFYTGNIAMARAHNAATSSGLGHLWSLAQEEQFYLVWPLLLILFTRARRLLPLTIALAAGLILWRAHLAVDGVGRQLYYRPDTHSDGLIIGAVLAIVLRRRPLLLPAGWQPWLVAAFAGWCVVGPLFAWEIVGRPVLELLCAGLVLAAVTESQLAVGLAWSPLVWLGKISYSLYLWHFMLLWAFGWNPLRALPVSFAAAWLSYRFVEQPFRRHRRTLGAATLPARPALLGQR
jgi:peptidoglycan/LPS O-acetylase OafA/YrhL